MKDKIKRFLTSGVAGVCAVCVLAFAALSGYLNVQNDQTITQLGNIYMSSINDRITKHFGSVTDQCLLPMKTLAENVPEYCEGDQESFYSWLTYSGHSRGYESVCWCDAEGHLESIYGEPFTFFNPEFSLDMMKKGESWVAVG